MTPGEIEATEFIGKKLTPISQQLNNALAGTQVIEKESYRLTVDGLVETPLSLSYTDLLELPQISKLMDLNCVEGWNFIAKWSGPELKAILNGQRSNRTEGFRRRDFPDLRKWISLPISMAPH
jgi:DMSO/TMAO reductase YedYZ molybdopterin-dependent catalytic subunit